MARSLRHIPRRLALAASLVSMPAWAADGHGGIENWEMLEQYCVECHNFADWAGGIAFDVMSPDTLADDAETWEAVVRKLEGRLMPPPGSPQPEKAELAAFVHSLTGELDEAAQGRPRPGYVTLHRLNRTEYANSIDALFGLDIDVAEMLPPDAKSEGFQNIADVLQVSPTFLDQYIAAAREISMRAVGNEALFVGSAQYLNPLAKNHNVRVNGLPLGSRGGLQVEHYFPAAGEYQVSIAVSSKGGSLLRSYPTGWLEFEHTLVILVDGAPVYEADLGGEDDLRAVDQEQTIAVTRIQDRFRDIPVTVGSGPHTITATFVGRTLAEGDDILQPLVPGEGNSDIPIIDGIQIVGPFDPGGIGDTPSRRMIFSCYPEAAEDARPCAEDIMLRLATQAFRRPVEERDLARLMEFYDAGYGADGFEAGVQRAIMAMLTSTNFLFRVEDIPSDLEPGESFALDDLELASRLAFFLWSEGPDRELLDLAGQGRLSDPAVLDAQIERMLADPRSRSLVTSFAFQWLNVEHIESIDPDARLFPNFDEDLRDAFVTELEMFVDSILREDRSVVDLLTADHTFVNERLALHYGLPNVQGPSFRRVELQAPERWGLLGKGGVLMHTSYPNRTSPVLRGAWILETLLGAPPAAPPPDVEADLDAGDGALANGLTVRVRLEQHRADQSCNQCHGVIDPLGLALENFDAVGAWRDIDRFAGQPIDASGRLAGGAPVEGPNELRQELASDPAQFARAFTEKFMTYALGRRVEYYDMPAVRAIVREAAEDDYRLAAIVSAIVRSDPFRMKAAPEVEAVEGVAATEEAALSVN